MPHSQKRHRNTKAVSGPVANLSWIIEIRMQQKLPSYMGMLVLISTGEGTALHSPRWMQWLVGPFKGSKLHSRQSYWRLTYFALVQFVSIDHLQDIWRTCSNYSQSLLNSKYYIPIPNQRVQGSICPSIFWYWLSAEHFLTLVIPEEFDSFLGRLTANGWI